MKNLKVNFIDADFKLNDYASFKKLLSNIDWNPISAVNWKNEYPYQPKVNFQIAHNNKLIILHYDVEEEFVKAAYVRPNEAVWEDSCVEFFISLDQKENYYNFEFNPLGTGLIGYGPSKKSLRNRLTTEQINQVSTYSQITNQKGEKKWSMIFIIPIETFAHTSLSSLGGVNAHANFYKCGDELPNPHFISWNAIDFPTPNFHLPEHFGSLTFE